MSDFLFFLIAFGSEVIGTMAGFGSSTVLLPLALFFFDFQTALVLVAFMHIFGNVSRVTFFRYGLDRRLLLFFGVPSILLTVVGALLVPFISQDFLKFILGFFLLAFVVLSSLDEGLRIPETPRTSFLGGGISGFFAGLIGTGGALRGAFLTSFGLKKEVYIATAALVAIAVDMTRIPVYLFNDFFPREFLWYLPILFLVALLGSYVGKRIVQRINQQFFRRIVLLAIFLVSIKFVVDGIGGLW